MVTQDNSTWWANWGKTICILRRWMAHQLHPWELIHRGQVRKFVRWGWDGLTITQSNCKNFDIAAHLYCLFLQNVRLSPDFACIWSQSLCHYPCCHVKRLLHRMLSQLGKCFPSQFTPWRKNLTLPKLFPLWNPGEILSGSWNLCSQFSRVKDWSWGQIISMEKSWQWHASALAGPLHSTIYPNKHCAGCGVFLCSGCCSGASGPIELAPDRFLEQL